MPYLEVLQEFAQFSWRASRYEFWPLALLHAGIVYFLVAIAILVSMLALLIGVLAFAYVTATLQPSLALLARCMHDTGR